MAFSAMVSFAREQNENAQPSLAGQLASGGPWQRLFLVIGANFLAAVIAFPCAWGTAAGTGVRAMALALAICLIGGGLAWVVTEMWRGPMLALYEVVVGFFLRMGLPLALSGIVQWQGGSVVAAGFIFYSLWFYGVTLMIQTWLTVSQIPKFCVKVS